MRKKEKIGKNIKQKKTLLCHFKRMKIEKKETSRGKT